MKPQASLSSFRTEGQVDPLTQEAKQVLEARREALLRLVERSVVEERSAGAQLQDRSDQISADEVSEVADRLSGRERRELQDIEGALRRMAAGTYGRCEGCGHAIGRQRLKAMPETRFCMSCSTRANAA